MSTPIQISFALITGVHNILYTAFSGTPTAAMLASLDAVNIASYDISVNIWHEQSNGTVLTYLASGMTVPALGSASYRGLVTFNTSSEKLRAIPSATGVHINGTVIEQ